MKPIVTFEDFLKTYPEKTQELVKIYFKTMNLRKKYGYGSKKIAKLLDISRHTIDDWLYEGQIPKPIKATKSLQQMKLTLPFVVSKNPRFKFFVKLLAFSFGDGGITSNFRPYFTGKEVDLKILKEEIKYIFPSFRCKIIKIKNKNAKINGRTIKGTSFILNLQNNGSCILGRLLYAAGAPKGNKVLIPFLVPSWIMNGEKWIKKLFLNVLLGNEVQAPRIDKSRSACFSCCIFRMTKIEKFKNTQKQFLNQIKKLLEDFGIQSSEVEEDSPRKERKDGQISYPLYFRIQKNKLNLYRFYKEFKLLYAKGKQEDFNDAIRVVKKSLEKELLKNEWYVKGQKLRTRKWGCRRIARYLGVPKRRSMIDGWLRYNQKPIYFNQREELKELLKN